MNEYPKMLYSDLEHYAIAEDFEAEQYLRNSGFVDFVDLNADDQVTKSLTKAQIIERLTAANIDHNPRASKADLQALLPE